MFLTVGTEVAAAATGVEPGIPNEPDGSWALGPVILGPAQQAADILTRTPAQRSETWQPVRPTRWSSSPPSLDGADADGDSAGLEGSDYAPIGDPR